MWQRIQASFSYGKKHQCNSYICKMYVKIYEPKTSSTKMNKRKCILCMPIKMSPALSTFKYFQPTCFRYFRESSYLELHKKQLSN